MLARMFYLSSFDIAGHPRDNHQVRLGLLAGYPDVHIVAVHHLAHPHTLLTDYESVELIGDCNLQEKLHDIKGFFDLRKFVNANEQ